MQKIILSILSVLLLCPFFFPAGCDHEPADRADQQLLTDIPGFDSEAIMVLAYLGRYQRGTTTLWPRVAFAIGDGTIVLTAAHCVQDLGYPRKQAVSPAIVVISPYYGDVFDFEILAVDKDADLAILKASWPVHPALSLASEEELKVAKEIVIASRPCLSPGGPKQCPYRLSRHVRAEKLPISKLSEPEPNEAIVLRETRRVVKGWSGSALVLPKSGKVVGVLRALREIRRKKESVVLRRDAVGCGIASIEALLKRHNLQSQSQASMPQLPPVEDANQAFDLAIDYLEFFLNGDLAGAVDVAKQLVTLRPQSVQAHLFLAFSAHDAYAVKSSTEQLLSLAESSFKEALTLDANNARAHAGYGNFLMEHKRYEQALKETEAALAIDPGNELALANHVNILTRTDPNQAEQIARRLVEKDPNNSHWWFWYYGALAKLGRHAKALDAAQKAVDLNPDGLYNGGLADVLVKLHRIDDAEPHYKKMTERCGCQLCWFKYADFLVDHRPEKLDEAEKALDQAESKKATRLSQKNLNMLRLRLLEKKSPEKAETLARKLLKQSPENGRYWWALAGILRTLERHEEAVQAARQAVNLRPDRSFLPRLANCLSKAGQLDEAEQTYNKMLRDHPERPKYWFWYARFLNEHYPNRLEEVRQALSKAQNPATDWAVPPDQLKDLQEKIDSNPTLHNNIQREKKPD